MSKEKIYDGVVLGAGPYGLSAAAELRKQGANILVFGKPMELWREHMPKGMLHRSRWWESSFSKGEHSIENYFTSFGKTPIDPLPEQTILEYGLWFLRNAVGEVDENMIQLIEKRSEFFLVTIKDGRRILCKSVILAPGMGYYKYIPELFNGFSKDLVSHTFDTYTLDQLREKRVAIIGGGQSGVETAALLSEMGIETHLIHRRPIDWLPTPKEKNIWEALMYPKSAICDGWDNWTLEHMPYLFHSLPRNIKDSYLNGKGANGPAASDWLKLRTRNVTFHHTQILSVRKEKNGISLLFPNRKHLFAQHIIAATGYRGNIQKLPMLHFKLIDNIKTYQGYPQLNSYFETTIPNLYILGFTAHKSFGPLYRFIAGSEPSGKRISQAMLRQFDKKTPVILENINMFPDYNL